jgi:hypothetical protein
VVEGQAADGPAERDGRWCWVRVGRRGPRPVEPEPLEPVGAPRRLSHSRGRAVVGTQSRMPMASTGRVLMVPRVGTIVASHASTAVLRSTAPTWAGGKLGRSDPDTA